MQWCKTVFFCLQISFQTGTAGARLLRGPLKGWSLKSAGSSLECLVVDDVCWGPWMVSAWFWPCCAPSLGFFFFQHGNLSSEIDAWGWTVHADRHCTRTHTFFVGGLPVTL